MKKNIEKELLEKNCIGRWVYFHDKNTGEEYRGLIIDEVVEISNDYAHRLQKIIWCQDYDNRKKRYVNIQTSLLEIGIRACYFVIDKRRKKIIFGQFAMNSNPRLVGKLFKKANRKGFFENKNPKQIQRELNKFLRKNPKIKLFN